MIVGNEVNEDFVKRIPQYAELEITPELLSQVALQQQSVLYSQGNTLHIDAVHALLAMKQDYGEGACTLVMIFNASGETLTFQENYDWEGRTNEYPEDNIIANGQYSVFIHVKTRPFGGSEGSVVYRGTTQADFLMAWCNPWASWNNVYASVQASNYWPDQQTWDAVYEKFILAVDRNTDEFTNGTYSIYSSIGSDTTSIASFTIQRCAVKEG